MPICAAAPTTSTVIRCRRSGAAVLCAGCGPTARARVGVVAAVIDEAWVRNADSGRVIDQALWHHMRARSPDMAPTATAATVSFGSWSGSPVPSTACTAPTRPWCTRWTHDRHRRRGEHCPDGPLANAPLGSRVRCDVMSACVQVARRPAWDLFRARCRERSCGAHHLRPLVGDLS